MATYSSGSMNGVGTPGQELLAGTTYTFELQNRDGNYPLRGSSYLVLDGSEIAVDQAGGLSGGTNTTITGSFGGFLNSINSSSLVTESTKWGIEMPDSGSIGGAFEFTPLQPIPPNSYAIRSTGNFELTITP